MISASVFEEIFFLSLFLFLYFNKFYVAYVCGKQYWDGKASEVFNYLDPSNK